MKSIEEKIQSQLFELQDTGYKEFHSRLVPTIAPETIIGVRIPVLRKLAKEVSKSPDADEFMGILPHKYYEENSLHGLMIENIKDYEKTIQALDAFLPYVDNWAVCDTISPKIFKKYRPELLLEIKRWIKSEHTYVIRFAIGMMLSFYLDDNFSVEYLDMVAAVRSQEYYINMMIAWYFATALAKQYDETVVYIEKRRLDDWTHNKAIQKAIESYRVTDEQKKYLRTLKVK